MKIIVLNCGSSSLKYQLIDSDSENVLAKGVCERIGIDDGTLTHQIDGQAKISEQLVIDDHKTAINAVLSKLVDKQIGVVSALSEIKAIGHRVVHGGEVFT